MTAERRETMLPAEVMRHRFTVEEYHKMAEVGLLHEDDRVELIEGEIVEMTPIGSRHHACVMRLDELLRRPGGEYIVSVQGPVRLDGGTEPQPDLALLKRRADFYAERLPGPEDVLLVVEIADTSIGPDRRYKLLLYARAGIPEAWLVDLQNEVVEVHTKPRSGGYASVRRYDRGDDELSSEIVPSLVLPVQEILG